jgi:hypothetical protein
MARARINIFAGREFGPASIRSGSPVRLDRIDWADPFRSVLSPAPRAAIISMTWRKQQRRLSLLSCDVGLSSVVGSTLATARTVENLRIESLIFERSHP